MSQNRAAVHSGVITAEGAPSENRYIFTDRRVQSVLGLALLAGGYFYWTHESLRLPTADEAAVMEEICPQAEAVIEADNGFQLKHPEIPFIRACKLFEDQRLVRGDFWQIAKAQRQDARNAILESSRHKIETAKSSADAELAAQEAKRTEQRVAARIEADAKIAEEQRKLAELQDYNKPENVQRRQKIADLEAAKLAAEAAKAEEVSNAEAARVEAEAKAARRVEAAKAKAEAARVKAAEEAERRRTAEAARQTSGLDQGRTAFPPVAPEPALRPASAPDKLQMNCHPEHSAPYFVTYNGNVGTVLVTGSETGRTRPYPVHDTHDDTGKGVFYLMNPLIFKRT